MSRDLCSELLIQDTRTDRHDPQQIAFVHWRLLVRHHPSAFLLAAQLLSLVLYAAFNGIHSGRALLGAFSLM